MNLKKVLNISSLVLKKEKKSKWKCAHWRGNKFTIRAWFVDKGSRKKILSKVTKFQVWVA